MLDSSTEASVTLTKELCPVPQWQLFHAKLSTVFIVVARCYTASAYNGTTPITLSVVAYFCFIYTTNTNTNFLHTRCSACYL